MEAPLSHAGVSGGHQRYPKPYKWALALTALVLSVLAIHVAATNLNPNLEHTVGEQIDDLNGVAIYFNGGVNTVEGRNLTPDGYNLGLRYQCVEFVKRYYF